MVYYVILEVIRLSKVVTYGLRIYLPKNVVLVALQQVPHGVSLRVLS